MRNTYGVSPRNFNRNGILHVDIGITRCIEKEMVVYVRLNLNKTFSISVSNIAVPGRNKRVRRRNRDISFKSGISVKVQERCRLLKFTSNQELSAFV